MQSRSDDAGFSFWLKVLQEEGAWSWMKLCKGGGVWNSDKGEVNIPPRAPTLPKKKSLFLVYHYWNCGLAFDCKGNHLPLVSQSSLHFRLPFLLPGWCAATGSIAETIQTWFITILGSLREENRKKSDLSCGRFFFASTFLSVIYSKLCTTFKWTHWRLHPSWRHESDRYTPWPSSSLLGASLERPYSSVLFNQFSFILLLFFFVSIKFYSSDFLIWLPTWKGDNLG